MKLPSILKSAPCKWAALCLAALLAAIPLFVHMLRASADIIAPRITMAQLDAAAAPFIDQARDGVRYAVGELCSHRLALFWDIVRDKLTGSAHAADRISDAIDDVVTPLGKAAAVYGCAATDSAADVLEQASADNLAESLYAAAGLALEGAFIRSTIDSCVRIVTRCAPKLAASWGLGGASALADGPAPFGDIIGAVMAIGGSVWCGWDLLRAFRSFPRDLTAALESAIDATISQCRLEAAQCL